MRQARLGLASTGFLLLATATGRAQGKPLPAPASAALPPVELAIAVEGGKPVCAPAALRLPADTNVDVHIVSTAAGQFENAHALHADGDLVHVASEKGYLVKRNGRGALRLRTPAPGDHDFACTSRRDAKAPFVGKLILTPPAG